MSLKVKKNLLPSGYTQLEYLQSSGTQWIDTGVIPDNTTGFKVRMAVPETVSDIFRFGCRQDSNNTRFIIGTMNGGAYLGFGNTLSSAAGSGSWAILQNNPFTAQLNYLNDRHAYINDVISSTNPIGDLSATTFTYPIIMFGRNSSGSVSSSAQSIYSCEITKGAEVIRKFIPAKNRTTDILGMYDLAWDGSQYGCVDLGTLTWSYNSQYQYFRASPPDKLANSINGYNATFGNLILYNSWGNIENNRIGIKADGSSDIAIKDIRFTDPATFQAAMSGKYFYYQRTTDPSWASPWYINSGTGTFTAGPEVTPTAVLKDVHELYKKNGDGVDYIGDLYKKNPESHNLPDGYTQLNYIQSNLADSTVQAISTDITAETYPIDLAVDFEITESTAYGNIFTAQGGGAQTRILRQTNNGSQLEWYSGGSAHTLGAVQLNHKYHAEIHYESGASYIILDGVRTNDTSTLEGFAQNFTLFCSSTYAYASKVKIYYAYITNGTTTNELIPAKNSSDALGMYDKVTGTFKENVRTGTFTAGVEVPKAVQIFSAGYDRTVSGATPLTIPDARTKPISWQIDGQSKQGLLPDGYTQLEYLQTDGNSCINTNLMITGNESWECVFENAGSNNLSSPVLGTLNGGSAFTDKNNFSITYTTAISPGAYAVYLDRNDGNAQHSWNGGLLTDHTKQTIRYTGLNTAPTINGVAMTQLTPTTLIAITPTVGVRLFGRATTAGNGTFAQSGVRIYSFKGDTWNFIPAKNSSNVLGMYEAVSGQFYTNAGTGTFTAGPVCPAPTSPVDVYAVGDKTENLYCDNVSKWTKPDSYYIFPITLEQGRQYRFKAFKRVDTPISSCVIALVKSGRLYSEFVGLTPCVNYQGAMINVSFTADDTWTDPALAIYAPNGHTIQEVFDSYNVDFIEGTAFPTEHIPYGYRVPIIQANNCGMVDLGTMNISRTAYGCSFEKSDMAQTETNAYITGYTLGRGDKTFRIVPVVSTVYVGIQDERFAGMTIEQIKELLSGKYLYYQRTTDSSWTAPTTSTIYLSAPLQKVGNYTDSVESDGTLTRGVCQLTLTGTENWSWNGANWFYLLTTVNIGSDESSELATHFKHSASTAEWGYFKLATNKYIYLFDSDGAKWGGDVTAMKSWLATQYAAGTPVVIYYPLATSTTSTITVPTILTVKGTNYLDAQTQVKPSNIEIGYRKRTK